MWSMNLLLSFVQTDAHDVNLTLYSTLWTLMSMIVCSLLHICYLMWMLLKCVSFISHTIWSYYFEFSCASLYIHCFTNRNPFEKTRRGFIRERRWWRWRYFFLVMKDNCMSFSVFSYVFCTLHHPTQAFFFSFMV